MNKSGLAVKNALRFWKIDPNNLLVIQDDSDIELGRLKISFGQSHGGHKGLASIIQALESSQFSRLKIGARPEFLKRNVAGKHVKAEKFILRSFPKKWQEIVSAEGKEAVYLWLESSLAKAMSKYNDSNYNFYVPSNNL